MGPVLAALIVVPFGQPSIAWFSSIAFLAIIILWRIGQWYKPQIAARKTATVAAHPDAPSSRRVMIALAVLVALLFSKQLYVSSLSSYYIFYLIDRFGVSIQTSQLMLFILLIAAAAGALLGGIVGDRIGRYRIIWISILGPLPFTLLLPYANFFWTGVLTVVINLVMASAFASILIYAMELIPDRIGLIGGLFYGLNFGLGGIAAAILGGLADHIGIGRVYQICSFLPLAGLLAWFLPRIEERRDAH
jgi:FSR family fosmidomycin resistance protein-like MFS transporter